MIDTRQEQLRLLSKASKEIPGNPHVSTVIRWSHRGVRGVKLETVIVGGRRFTSLEAIDRFIYRLSHVQETPKGKACRPDDEQWVSKQLDELRI
jgi:hypothetical protein